MVSLNLTLTIESPALDRLAQALECNMATIDDLREATGQVGQAIGALAATVQTTMDRVVARLDNLTAGQVTQADVDNVRDDLAPLRAMSEQLAALASDPSTGIPEAGTGLDGLGGGTGTTEGTTEPADAGQQTTDATTENAPPPPAGTTNPDGSVTNPDGSVTNPDGSVTNPDGSVTPAPQP